MPKTLNDMDRTEVAMMTAGFAGAAVVGILSRKTSAFNDTGPGTVAKEAFDVGQAMFAEMVKRFGQ